MTETPRHSVSVAAAIFDESGHHVLLIKRRDNGKWEPPGGVLELDESIDEGLRREVLEETQGEIAVGPLTGIYKNLKHGIVALVFRCHLAAESVVGATSEATSVAWWPLSEVEGVVDPVYAIRITDASKASSSAVPVRSHDGERLLGEGDPSAGPMPSGTIE